MPGRLPGSHRGVLWYQVHRAGCPRCAEALADQPQGRDGLHGLAETGVIGQQAAAGAGPATSVPPSAALRVDLYSDEAGRQTLPLKASDLRDYPTRRTIPRSGTARLSIPFYARVVAQQLLNAGDYNFSREIGLAYRPGAMR